MHRVIFFFITVSMGLSGCSFERLKMGKRGVRGEINTTSQLSFARIEEAVLKQHCNSCHNPSSPGGRLITSDYEALMGNPKGVVVKGEPEKSSLYLRLVTKDRGRLMPKNRRPLAEQEIELIKNWILAGAPEFAKDEEVPDQEENEEEEEEPETPEELNPVYSYVFKKVLEPRCMSCHTGGSKKSAKAIGFDEYDALMESGLIKPGDSSGSLLFQLITTNDPKKLMPEGGPKLPAKEITLIQRWIDQGAKEKASIPQKVTYADVYKKVLKARCDSCHAEADSFDDVITDNYDKLMASGSITKGDLTKSRFYQVLITQDDFELMPEGGPKLPDDEIALIRRWILLGAPK